MTLRSNDPDAIQKMFRRMGASVERIVDRAIWISYFMRGAITYEEALLRTPGEQQRLLDFIDKRLDSQKDKMNPVY